MPLGVRSKIAFAVGVALAAGTAAYATSTGSAAQGQDTLVVDRSFEIRTSDPQRAFEPTARSSTAASTTPCSRSEAATSRVRC